MADNKNCRIETFLGDSECPPILDKNNKMIGRIDACGDCYWYLTDEVFKTKKKQYGVV